MNYEKDRKAIPLPLPELPWDTLAMIFEETAWAHRPTTLNLTLVSKEVQHAADQVLFKHISIAGSTAPQTTSMLTTMFLSPKPTSPRLLRARTFIYSLYSEKQINWELLFAMISECPALRSLSAALIDSQLLTISCSTLRRLSYQLILGTGATFPTSEILCQPLFQTITHLDFFGSLTILNDLKDVWPKGLFQLTHLCIFFGAPGDIGNLVGVISSFVRSLPGHLEIIILSLVIPPAMRDISASPLYEEIQTGELDVRVILADSDPYGSTWEEAEVIVASRKASSLRTIKVEREREQVV